MITHPVSPLVLICSFLIRGLRALAGPIAGGAIAAAACALNVPAGLAGDRGSDPALVPAPPAPLAVSANRDLGELLNSGPEIVVAGERLNTGLLRRFYARYLPAR